MSPSLKIASPAMLDREFTYSDAEQAHAVLTAIETAEAEAVNSRG